MSKSKTPLMRQYDEIKAKHPGTILLFRVGDFYETFSDDAVLISKELGITLTKRNNGGDQTPLAGFPYHSLDSYLPKLVRRGHRVAVCDQTEDPASAKAQGRKIVEREVMEVVTPGVTMSDKLLDQKRNNYVCALHFAGSTVGVSFSDITTGEFGLCQIPKDELKNFLPAIQPSEIILPKKLKGQLPDALNGFIITYLEDWVFEGDYGFNLLTDHFKTHSLKGFGVDGLDIGQVSAGALLHYVKENQKASLGQLRRLYVFENSDYMMLHQATKGNLELTASMQDGNTEGTLISILDETCTAMGGRMLRKWLMQPLKNLRQIRNRLNSVEAFYIKHSLRTDLRDELEQVGDLERLISKICVGRANARDLLYLSLSIAQIPQIKKLIAGSEEPLIQSCNDDLKLLTELQDYLSRAIVDDPPASIRDGGFIREEFSEELAEVRDIARNGKAFIARIQKQLAEESGIASLKLGFNKVFGYYIEVSNAHKDKVPEHFIRKQTLVNAERYITPELKEIEEKILSAEERMSTLETDIFRELLLYVSEFAEEIQNIARAIGELDCLQSLAEVAYRYNYNKPTVNDDHILNIKAGRHPVVERTLEEGEPFIPNDVSLDNENQQIMIITGPNMAGKSIVLRQVGLIVLLAQIGSFVPAKAAQIGIVDKIFTRVGASDNLAAGESTFLVEMNEAANILNNASQKSLILLDEVGRGTSTFDGLSIAWALAEYLHNQPAVAAKTLFATHYHELNELETLYERVVNFNVQVKEHNGKVIFLRKLVKGGADHSYGIQVASMAGLPVIVINRAKEILTNLESHSLDITNKNGTLEKGAQVKKEAAAQAVKSIPRQDPLSQMSLFQAEIDPNLETIKNKLEGCDPNRMTPIESLLLITELKRLISE